MYVNQTTLIEYNIDLKMDEKEKFFLNTQHRFTQISSKTFNSTTIKKLFKKKVFDIKSVCKGNIKRYFIIIRESTRIITKDSEQFIDDYYLSKLNCWYQKTIKTTVTMAQSERKWLLKPTATADYDGQL